MHNGGVQYCEFISFCECFTCFGLILTNYNCQKSQKKLVEYWNYKKRNPFFISWTTWYSSYAQKIFYNMMSLKKTSIQVFEPLQGVESELDGTLSETK